MSSHPIALIVAILLQTLFCCLALASLNTTSWFSFILFLIFLGGLMVLFIYISSLASNEKFTVRLQKAPSVLAICAAATALFLWGANEQLASLSYTNEVKLLTNMYSSNILAPTLITILYLLLTLVVVVRITSKYEGPLRNITYA